MACPIRLKNSVDFVFDVPIVLFLIKVTKFYNVVLKIKSAQKMAHATSMFIDIGACKVHACGNFRTNRKKMDAEVEEGHKM
jgi:hypothetical protein